MRPMTRLEELRRKKGLTQLQMQMRFGIDQGDYSKIERGLRTPSMPVYIQFALFFDTSVDYLVGLTDDPRPYPRSEQYREP